MTTLCRDAVPYLVFPVDKAVIMMYSRFAVSGTIGALACSALAFAQSDKRSDCKQRLQSEAPQAWSRYYTMAIRLQGSVTVKATTEPPRTSKVEAIMEFKQGLRGALAKTRQVSSAKHHETPEWELSGANSKYRFNLHRVGDGGWRLTHVSTDLITEPQARPSLSVTNWIKGCVAAPIAINYNLKDDWPAMLSSSDFRMLSAAVIQEGLIELVKVEFEVQWKPSETNLIRVVGRGRVWFDPNHLWVMRKCEYRHQRGPKGRTYDHMANYEYQITDAEFPLLKRLMVQNFDANGKLESLETSDFSLALADVDESEFTLSAFGLPEPHGVGSPQSTRWWLWLLLAMVIVLATAGLCIKLAKRYSGRQAGSQ